MNLIIKFYKRKSTNDYPSMLPPSQMIIYHYLFILLTNDIIVSCRVVFIGYIRIHIDYLSIPLISKEQTLFTITGVNFEIRRVIGNSSNSFPVIITQISWLWQEKLLACKVWLEIFCFQSMSEINVPTNHVLPLMSQEDYGQQSAIQDEFFPL